MNPRRSLAIAAGKMAGALSRRLGKGGGTSLPGLVALAIDPGLLPGLARQVPQAILVTGTNGKTTTSAMIASMLRAGGFVPLQNQTGSNLLRGLTTALMARCGPGGRLKAVERSVIIFEVDEAVLPLAASATRPRTVLFNNLFRDQLDRYGEVDTVRSLWLKAVGSLPGDTVLVLNADDPAVAGLADAARGTALFFGVEDRGLGVRGLEHAADSLRCLKCGDPYEYSASFYAHLGHYRCRGCGSGRPQPQVTASSVAFDGFEGACFRLEAPQGSSTVSLKLGGLYNVYNALAAAAAGLALGLPLNVVAEALERFSPAFGRLERLVIDGRRVCLILVKNPTGFNQVLRALGQGPLPDTVMMALNDRIADGRDVSWIWDVDFDGLEGVRLVVSGLRAEDMALRLKYGGMAVSKDAVWRDLAGALDRALESTPEGGTLYVLPTYTAMLELQRLLARRGHLQDYWRQK
ncbi:MAG: MurT ligase domain-containing protein [Dehalococcoidia bacterium]|nr:MurT ligase domain-containing protein [Dehalococcoidia bacterium]